jgi:dihydropteroate synthase
MDVHVQPRVGASGARAGPVVDVDALAQELLGGEPDIAAVVALAAIATWRGATTLRTRYAQEVRRAADMAATIAGTRQPALTVRGLA